jgi:hypothetical protein
MDPIHRRWSSVTNSKPPTRNFFLLKNGTGTGSKCADVEDQEIDKAIGISKRKWNFHDFVDFACMTL